MSRQTPHTILLLAGNGFIGRRLAVQLAADGHMVIVHHTGTRPVPDHPHIEDIRVAKSPRPITQFPAALIRRAKGATIVHLQCMGAADGAAFVETFGDVAQRLVLISSCDVYRAYGRFIGLETGPPEAGPLSEGAALRAVRHPYRSTATDPQDWLFWYDKIDAEAALSAGCGADTTILRLPKVFGPKAYGPGANASLDTVYSFAHQPYWRWTHGYVDNVAAAIATACTHPLAANQTFNLGEAHTPTMGERLARLPPRPALARARGTHICAHDLWIDTQKIRRMLGYSDPIDETAAMADVAAGAA